MSVAEMSVPMYNILSIKLFFFFSQRQINMRALVRVRLLLFCCVLVASEPGLDIIPFFGLKVHVTVYSCLGCPKDV